LIRSYYNINPFAEDISSSSAAEIGERKDEFPAVSIETVPYRVYNDSEYVAHVLGYIGKLTDTEFKANAAKGYLLNDLIGKDGVELSLEDILRGKNGYNIVQKNDSGVIVKQYTGQKAIPGKDVVLTIDMNLQKVALDSLKRTIADIKSHVGETANLKDAYAGAAVAIDVNTGEILAMVSYPSYDPSVFLQTTPEAAAQKALWQTDNDNIPLYNRAIAGIYAPGSTFKPITAMAGLATGTLDPNAYFGDPGFVVIDNQRFQDVGSASHGSINLLSAIAKSCNIYFHTVGMNAGIEAIDHWTKEFGLGEKTGIQLPGEMAGIRSNPETKYEIYQEPWGRADTAQTAIGQFNQAFTPLQMANYAATIGNGGRRYDPLLLKSVLNPDGSVFETDTAQVRYTDIEAKQEWMALIKEGMIEVLKQYDNYASIPFKGLPFEVAGKTGTAETSELNHSSNALFISYAPADKPQIAVAVVIERGVWGAYCAPVAADIIKEYMKTNVLPNDNIETVSAKAIFSK
jgi:penicillin-binding protein 2